jgi:pyridoxal phosphate enzyme (YggS family)
MNDVAANVAAVRRRIRNAAERAGRDPNGVLLVAAAKTRDVGLVDAALGAGVTDVGENYVQEAAAKQAQVRGTARWHMIGHLQRNKARRAVEIFDTIETVDDAALGATLSRLGERRSAPVRVLVEVNLAAEASKSGVAPGALAALVAELRACPFLSVDGLMTVPPIGPAGEMRPYFRRLRELRDGLGLRELSMGMSNDFETAIEEGATIIRVGTAIFGERTE